MTDILSGMSLLAMACIIGALSSISFGIVGTLVVTKRISYIAAAISHCVLGGIGASLYLQHHYHLDFFTPKLGAICAAVIAALLISLIRKISIEREDTLIGALWALGMGSGLLFIAKTPGYIDPLSYLFGSIIIVSPEDVLLVLGLDLLIIATVYVLYNKLVAICFDEEFAGLRGVNTGALYTVLLLLIALTIVLLVDIVGILLIIALLTIPPALAALWSKTIGHGMIWSSVICFILTVLGLLFGYHFDLPSGASIITLASCVYIVVIVLVASFKGRRKRP